MLSIDLTADLIGNSHYIARARQHRPTVPAEVSEYVVNSYVRLRKEAKDEDAQKKSHTYTSPRTLLGVLRLSQALARLRFADSVMQADVNEALRLMEVSKKSLVEDDEEGHDHDRSDVSKIFRLIKEMAKQAQVVRKGRRTRGAKRLGRGPGGERDMDVDEEEEEEDAEELSMIDIRSRVLTTGFTEAQLMETVLEVRQLYHAYHLRHHTNAAHSTRASTSGPVSRTTRNCASLKPIRSIRSFHSLPIPFCFVHLCRLSAASSAPCCDVCIIL